VVEANMEETEAENLGRRRPWRRWHAASRKERQASCG
jgi:hypothetical protein